MVWEDNGGIGLTYPIGPRVAWSGGVGGIYVHRESSPLRRGERSPG